MSDFPDPANSSLVSVDDIRILHEDKDFIFVRKPAGILVHRLPRHEPRPQDVILTDWLINRYPELKSVGDAPDIRPGIVHRLDRDTSGVMVIAKTKESFEYLKNLFQKHEVKKTYKALVFGYPNPASGFIRKPIALKQGSLKRATQGKKLRLMKEASTGYRTVQCYEFQESPFALIAVSPETGRTHQIRVHLASIGNPVVGDRLYGVSPKRLQVAESLGLDRQFLHAEAIEFTNLNGERIGVSDDLPIRLARALDQLSPVPADHSSHS